MGTILWLLLAPAALARDPRADLDAAVARAWAEHPVEAAAAAAAEPIRTRNGLPRFVGEDVWNPAVTPILLERAISGEQDPQLRQALIEAAVRSGGDWDEVVVAQLGLEPDPAVRRMLAEVLREAGAGPAAEGLALAVQDEEAAVRAAAMRALGGRADGAKLGSLVLDGLDDVDADVRKEAARSAGWLALDQGWEGLTGLLADPDPDVRLNAIRALERLDAPRLSRLPALAPLRADVDPRVARAAASVH